MLKALVYLVPSVTVRTTLVPVRGIFVSWHHIVKLATNNVLGLANSAEAVGFKTKGEWEFESCGSGKKLKPRGVLQGSLDGECDGNAVRMVCNFEGLREDVAAVKTWGHMFAGNPEGNAAGAKVRNGGQQDSCIGVNRWSVSGGLPTHAICFSSLVVRIECARVVTLSGFDKELMGDERVNVLVGFDSLCGGEDMRETPLNASGVAVFEAVWVRALQKAINRV